MDQLRTFARVQIGGQQPKQKARECTVAVKRGRIVGFDKITEDGFSD
jgi:hypothetical protein